MRIHSVLAAPKVALKTELQAFRSEFEEDNPKMLRQYVRKGPPKKMRDTTEVDDKGKAKVYYKKQGPMVGMLLAFVKKGKLLVGWSKCNMAAGDSFDKDAALFYAAKRASEKPFRKDKVIPGKICKKLKRFIKLAEDKLDAKLPQGKKKREKKHRQAQKAAAK